MVDFDKHNRVDQDQQKMKEANDEQIASFQKDNKDKLYTKGSFNMLRRSIDLPCSLRKNLIT